MEPVQFGTSILTIRIGVKLLNVRSTLNSKLIHFQIVHHDVPYVHLNVALFANYYQVKIASLDHLRSHIKTHIQEQLRIDGNCRQSQLAQKANQKMSLLPETNS